MTFVVQAGALATAELKAAAARYAEVVDTECASRFLDDYTTCIALLEEMPEIYQVLRTPDAGHQVRSVNLKKFPYKVFFIIVGPTVFVTGVRRQSQASIDDWRGRLS